MILQPPFEPEDELPLPLPVVPILYIRTEEDLQALMQVIVQAAARSSETGKEVVATLGPDPKLPRIHFVFGLGPKFSAQIEIDYKKAKEKDEEETPPDDTEIEA